MSDSQNHSPSISSGLDTVRDVFLWRRKKLSLSVLLMATVTWVLLDVYDFNFITVASWVAIVVDTWLFLYGNLVRLFHKEEPRLSGWEISEEKTVEIARSVKESIEEGIRWMFQVSAESDWMVFARVVVTLFILSYVGTFTDFLTLLYIGLIGGMSVPVIYEKNEERIKRSGEWMRMQTKRLYDKVDEKALKKIKNKMAQQVKVEDNKEKKVE